MTDALPLCRQQTAAAAAVSQAVDIATSPPQTTRDTPVRQ